MSSRCLLMSLLLSGCPYISVDELDARMDLDGDGVPRPEDCDDDDPAVGGAVPWYADYDGDGWGSEETREACELPEGFCDRPWDCDDASASIHPDSEEICNGLDDDCDGVTDPADAADALTWYHDVDGDGYGDASTASTSCGCPGTDWIADGTDCDDTEASAHPGAEEIWYDGIDGDCLGGDDFDQDGDGFPSAEHNGTDCDDLDASVNPSIPEECADAIDNDCDGVVANCRIEGALTLDSTDPHFVMGDGSSNFAQYAAAAGDVTGDGQQDLVFGNPYWDQPTKNSGAAFLTPGPFEEGARILDQDAVMLTGSWSGSLIGGDSIAAGDLTGDGVDDLLVGGGYSLLAQELIGEQRRLAWILPGPHDSSGELVDLALPVFGPLDPSGGLSASGGFDQNGDGVPDLAVLGNGSLGGAEHQVHAFLVHGPIQGDSYVEDGTLSVSGDADGAELAQGRGYAAFGGDLDGDGLGEIALSSTGELVFLFSGDATGSLGLGDADGVFGDEYEAWELTHSLVAPGDQDGDGYGDLLVSEPDWAKEDASWGPGKVYLLPGGVSLPEGLGAATVEVQGHYQYGGIHVSDVLGDLSGDGVSEIAIQSSFEPDCSYKGSISILQILEPGSWDLDELRLAVICGKEGTSAHSARAAGDVNADGFADVLVSGSASDELGESIGAVYLLYGGFAD
jgi:hypothetical protein